MYDDRYAGCYVALFFVFCLVIPKVPSSNIIENEDRLIPQWAVVMIVIGIGGLLFIIVFGVSVVS